MPELRLNNLRVSTSRLDAVSTATAVRRTQAASGNRGPVASFVSADVLAETRTDGCRCEDPDHMDRLGLPTLEAGTPIQGATGLLGNSPNYNYSTGNWEPVLGGGPGLGAGCTTGRHVCNRLTKIRKRYGV